MKRIIAFLLALMMALMPTMVFAAKSPTIEKMIYARPTIHYSMVNYDDSWQALLSDLQVEYAEALDELFENGQYALDEALILEIDKPYNYVVWRFMWDYPQNTTVAMLLVGDQTPTCVLQQGMVLKNGTVLFDFTDFEPDIYYMFVFSNMTGLAND